jgi:hypothetical protein
MRRYTIGLIAALVFVVRPVEAQAPDCGRSLNYPELFRTTYKALVSALSRRIAECMEGTLLFAPRTDGGGDGGGGDGGGGGGGDGSGSDGGAGDSGGDGSGDSTTGDGPSGDTGTVGDPGDQGDPGNNDDAAQADPTTDPANVSAIANPNDVPTDDPALGLRGPGSPGGNGVPNGSAFNLPGATSPIPPGGSSPGARVDVGISAVVVSGASNPWDAVGKAPGVQNVTVTGAIIAMGEAPLERPSRETTVSTGKNPPAWLKLKPDLRYLNGSVFPPIVPNVIDIRTMSFSEQVLENPSN